MASDSTNIIPAGTPALTITKTHVGNFTQGQMNATYTLTVTKQHRRRDDRRTGDRERVSAAGADSGVDGGDWVDVQPDQLQSQHGARARRGGAAPVTTTDSTVIMAP